MKTGTVTWAPNYGGAASPSVDETLGKMIFEERMLAVQCDLSKDPKKAIRHKQNEFALCYARLRLKEHFQ